MKAVTTILAALFTSAAAAPAIVWSETSKDAIHSSDPIHLSDLVGGNDRSLSSVVFIVDRDENKAEALTSLTASGALPKVAGKYGEASAIHHSVRGIETISKAAKELGGLTAITLEDYVSLSGEKKATINDEGNVSGEITVVSISKESNPSDIDSIVSAAIEDSSIGSVVLTSVRGLSEVKFERELLARQQYASAQERISRRRLEDGNGDNAQESYPFVLFTPNIFSGLIFFFFFATVTYIGIGCMGMISGQDLYVTKYPTIGREA